MNIEPIRNTYDMNEEDMSLSDPFFRKVLF